MVIDYEIQQPSSLSSIWKTFCNKKPYYKIKNNTKKTLTFHCVTKSTQISQDYKKLGKKLKKSKDKNFKLNTTAKFSQKIQKVVLGPTEKIKIFYKKLLPIYWINEETNMLFSITGFRMFDKIVFDEYEEEEGEKYQEDKIIEEEIQGEKGEENIFYPIIKVPEKIVTEYEQDMNKINNNFCNIDNILKSLKKEQ
jgi:hypothetical protein